MSASFTEASIDHKDLFDKACKAAGLQHKDIAGLMDIREETLYGMLCQRRPLSIVRLIQLKDSADGRKFLRAYWPLVGEAMGLPEFSDGLRVADALQQFIANLQVRMVKCELVSREVQDEKRSA